jgi:apolipoprotein N-acyltransferase
MALVMGGTALACGALLALGHAVSPRLSPWLRALPFPALWTAFAFLSAVTSAHGTAVYLSASQGDFPLVAGVTALTGMPGLELLLLAVPSGLAWAARGEARAAVVPAALLLATLAYGASRLADPLGPPRTVALLADDRAVARFGTLAPEESLAVVDGFARRVAALAGSGSQFAVLPEKFVTLRPAVEREARRRLAEAARTGGLTLVAGLDLRTEDDRRRNVAVVFGPEGEVLSEYDKQHLVPGWEDRYRPATELAWADPRRGVGLAICKDLDFPELARRYALAGARVLVVPAWDFEVDGALHARHAKLRALESGLALVRVAAQGLLTVMDARGRVIAERPTVGDAGPPLLLAEVREGTGPTWYARLGDVAGWSIGALAVALTALAAVRRPAR